MGGAGAGLGHVNTLPEARVVAQMAARGWARDERASARLRAAASFPHFRAHVLAFSRAPWPPEPRGKPRGCPAPASPHSVVVLARVLYEQPFLAGFVDWYAARGVECVLLVRDGLDDAGDVAALPPVAVQRAASRGVHANAIIQATLADVRATGYAWMLVVDADEYLALHPRFDRSLPRFIEMQAARVPHLAAIQFSWAAAEALGAACPARAPFDAFFANAHVKTLARVDRVDRWVNPHAPVLRLREADCPGLPRECPVVLSGGRAVAATRGRRRGSAAEYGLPFFTAAPPRATGCTSLTCPAASGPKPGPAPAAAYADAALAHVHVRSTTNVLVKACGAAPDRTQRRRTVANATGLRAAALARGPLDLGKFVRDAGLKGRQMLGEHGCLPAIVASQGCTGDVRAPVDLAHLDWGPGGWTFCDAARERAIAEGVVARCLGVAADAVPRLAGAVAAAVREATRPPAPTRTRPQLMITLFAFARDQKRHRDTARVHAFHTCHTPRAETAVEMAAHSIIKGRKMEHLHARPRGRRRRRPVRAAHVLGPGLGVGSAPYCRFKVDGLVVSCTDAPKGDKDSSARRSSTWRTSKIKGGQPPARRRRPSP